METWEKQGVLITGGCGNIGSYLTELLVEKGAEVTVIDNLESGKAEYISAVRDEVELVDADLKRWDVCNDVMEGQNVVFNLAGRTHGVGYSDSHHGEMLYHNTVMQLNALEAARVNGVDRFLATSSSCVYPDDSPIPTPELPVEEGRPEQGNKGYGWGKRVAELQAKYYHDEYDMDLAIARPFNIYGPRYKWRGSQNSHVIPAIVKRVMDGEDPLTIWGSGDQRRNFLHARDAAELMIAITENYAEGDPVNLGFESETTITELVATICDVAGKDPEFVYDESKPEGAFRKGADADKLREVTGAQEPSTSLEEGMEDMIDWYRSEFN